MNPIQVFEQEREQRIATLANDAEFKEQSRAWVEQSMRKQYVYNFSWLGRPIIQNPVDMVGLQEIIFKVQPDLIIETGIAHGGSLIFLSSMLELNALCHGGSVGQVLGIDIDIRAHNKAAILAHPLSRNITMFEGSSIDAAMIDQVHRFAAGKKKVLVCLDSNHTYEHVKQELQAYASLVSQDSYCIVFDTFVDDVPKDVFPDRPWGPDNNPKTAVREFVSTHPQFVIDESIHSKLMLSSAPHGFLKRIA
jgi:cephalosporin hydroxylase